MTVPNSTQMVKALLIGILALGITACSFPNKPMTTAAAEMSEPLTSGEILHVLHIINQGEIEQAELALQKSQDRQILQIAQMIMRDHTMSNQRISTLLQTTGTSLEESALSEGVQLQAREIRQELAELSGTQFNRTYLQKQVELHDVALDTVRSQLLPNANNLQVRQLLNQSLPKLEMHRREAQESLSQTFGS